MTLESEFDVNYIKMGIDPALYQRFRHVVLECCKTLESSKLLDICIRMSVVQRWHAPVLRRVGSLAC